MKTKAKAEYWCGVCVALFALACAEYTMLACQVAEERGGGGGGWGAKKTRKEKELGLNKELSCKRSRPIFCVGRPLKEFP